MTRVAARDGRRSAFAGATRWDAEILNPYLQEDKKYGWGAEEKALEWRAAFIQESEILTAAQQEVNEGEDYV